MCQGWLGIIQRSTSPNGAVSLPRDIDRASAVSNEGAALP